MYSVLDLLIRRKITIAPVCFFSLALDVYQNVFPVQGGCCVEVISSQWSSSRVSGNSVW